MGLQEHLFDLESDYSEMFGISVNFFCCSCTGALNVILLDVLLTLVVKIVKKNALFAK